MDRYRNASDIPYSLLSSSTESIGALEFKAQINRIPTSTPVNSDNESEDEDVSNLQSKVDKISFSQGNPFLSSKNPFDREFMNPYDLNLPFSLFSEHPSKKLDDKGKAKTFPYEQFEGAPNSKQIENYGQSELSLKVSWSSSDNEAIERSHQMAEINRTLPNSADILTKSDTSLKSAEKHAPIFCCDELPVDDVIFLPPVNRDPNFQLPIKTLPINNKEFQLYITEVFSPVHFWFHYGDDVEELMEEMMIKYKNLSAIDLSFSQQNIKVGLLVAAYIPLYENWNRAKVIKQPDNNHMVRLFFLDYGTVENIHMKDIKYLYPEFLKYARCAYQGRLLNLKPKFGEPNWNEEDVTRFIAKIANIPFQAKVIKISPNEESAYELDISFVPKGATEFNLRQWVIENSIADPFQLIGETATYPFCYHFPTFAMLEKEYPTFHEKSQMKLEGIDYDFLVEHNFFENLSFETIQKNPKILSMLGNKLFKKTKDLYFPPK